MSISSADAPAALARRLLHYVRPRQLQLVVRMAELGAMQKAAADLGMSQPSATEALNRVEALLDLTLFDRHARGVRLTPEGALLLPALKRALAAIDLLAGDAARIAGGASGLVRIAGIAAASTAVAAPALPAMCAAQPALWIDYREIEAADIAALLHERAADLVLCRASVQVPDGHRFTPLRPDRIGLYCGSGHPLARLRRPTLERCARETWLLPPEGSPPHAAFAALCERLGSSPAVARVSTRTMALSVALVCELGLLYVGLGSHMDRFVASGRLHRLPIDVPGAPAPIGCLHPQPPASEAAATVLAHLVRWGGGEGQAAGAGAP
ncbi:LysR family transcriptional regulator [Pseudacidovorax sp. RU35E]|uniref:LysR family transcriptional regulator n=1 Tax=Pseudacidovorax sp. RU35E TaxID=1907403 RepID=UPI0009573433|nr:LysR family transcriptional regulator [Pseudacidovorax sp. RU35E]SIQ52684.1 DNA-binding transcriptional regulator, LysR family [Pseudacidovorax sp. RU35E]